VNSIPKFRKEFIPLIHEKADSVYRKGAEKPLLGNHELQFLGLKPLGNEANEV
jgi:hypothetical protein